LSIKVRELESPLGVLPMAVLRSPDIVSFTVDLPQQSSAKRHVTWQMQTDVIVSAVNDFTVAVYFMLVYITVILAFW